MLPSYLPVPSNKRLELCEELFAWVISKCAFSRSSSRYSHIGSSSKRDPERGWDSLDQGEELDELQVGDRDHDALLPGHAAKK